MLTRESRWQETINHSYQNHLSASNWELRQQQLRSDATKPTTWLVKANKWPKKPPRGQNNKSKDKAPNRPKQTKQQKIKIKAVLKGKKGCKTRSEAASYGGAWVPCATEGGVWKPRMAVKLEHEQIGTLLDLTRGAVSRKTAGKGPCKVKIGRHMQRSTGDRLAQK